MFSRLGTELSASSRNMVPNARPIYEKSQSSLDEECELKIHFVNLAGDLEKDIFCLTLTPCTFQIFLYMGILVNCTQPRRSKTFLTFFFQKHQTTACPTWQFFFSKTSHNSMPNLWSIWNSFFKKKKSNTKMGFFANGGSTPLGIWDLQIPIALEI